MYTSIENQVLDKIKGMERATYVSIKRFINFTTYKARVSYNRIAEELGSSKNTAMKYVKQLVEKGVILQKLNYNKEKREYDTSEYYFVEEMVLNNNTQVIQSHSKSGSEIGKVLSKEEMNRNEKEIDTNLLKSELLKDYGEDIIDRAFKTFKKATKRGTVIDNIKAYINKLCSNIKAQDKLVESIKDNIEPSSNNYKKSKNLSGRNTKVNGWNIPSISRISSQYTSEELENILKNK